MAERVIQRSLVCLFTYLQLHICVCNYSTTDVDLFGHLDVLVCVILTTKVVSQPTFIFPAVRVTWFGPVIPAPGHPSLCPARGVRRGGRAAGHVSLVANPTGGGGGICGGVLPAGPTGGRRSA